MHTFAGVQEKLPRSHLGLSPTLPALALRMPGSTQSTPNPTGLRTQTGGLRGTGSPQLCIKSVPESINTQAFSPAPWRPTLESRSRCGHSQVWEPALYQNFILQIAPYILSHEVTGYLKKSAMNPFVRWRESTLREPSKSRFA